MYYGFAHYSIESLNITYEDAIYRCVACYPFEILLGLVPPNMDMHGNQVDIPSHNFVINMALPSSSVNNPSLKPNQTTPFLISK